MTAHILAIVKAVDYMTRTRLRIGLLIVLLAIVAVVLFFILNGIGNPEQMNGTLIVVSPKTECAYIPVSGIETGDFLI